MELLSLSGGWFIWAKPYPIMAVKAYQDIVYGNFIYMCFYQDDIYCTPISYATKLAWHRYPHKAWEAPVMKF